MGILACVSHISLSLPLFLPNLALSGEKMLDMAEEIGIDNRALGSVVDRSVSLRCERYGNETHISIKRLDLMIDMIIKQLKMSMRCHSTSGSAQHRLNPPAQRRSHSFLF